MALPRSPHCVITGAGGGFGRALALELAGRKARLVLSDVDLHGAEESARLALAAGASSARATRCDVTKVDDWVALASSCEGPIDLVVNNAGVSSAGKVGELPIEDWRWTLEVDLFGVINGCHVFAPVLRKQGHGHVLNVASAAGLFSPPFMGAYNVAKAGVIALSETLRAEFSGTDVGVTVACPTFFKTNIVSSGRIADEKLRERAQGMVDGGKTAAQVARGAIASVDRGELYALPMADARWLWRVKRAAPTAFNAAAGRIGRRAAK
ncbi:MAG TPA: SDR family NAD(P)-dependent oxidoreductase [Polyangiaceae bacterium]|jgi:NAD(P)-dependent dehydrogenase (short-subunit alcohol dehydrogenase family)|nr:SDR family NAD(P)-dependent oxidoreductase [Polyangiaceae bacterium]